MLRLLTLVTLVVYSFCVVNGINHNTIGALLQPEQETLFVLLNSARSFDQINSKVIKVIQDFDAQNYGPVRIGMTNIDDDEEIYETERMAQGLGVQTQTAPHIVFVNKNLDKYYFNGTLGVQNIQNFIEDARSQKIKFYLKSEPIPEGQEKQTLKKVVANNLVDQIWDSKDQILLYLYKGDSKSCDKFEANVLSKVIQRTKTSPRLKFYKINVMHNQLVNLPNLSKTPNLMFFREKKWGDLPALYLGQFDRHQDIILFLKAESKLGIVDPLDDCLEMEL